MISYLLLITSCRDEHLSSCLPSKIDQRRFSMAFVEKDDRMENMLFIGDKDRFGIRSTILSAEERKSFFALGSFSIYVLGRSHGVEEQDATMLACSFDGVKDRLTHRGQHRSSFDPTIDAFEIVRACLATHYRGEFPQDDFVGFPLVSIAKEWHDKDIVWAPDGDEAFDDGSYVLQFDLDEFVRIIAFKNEDTLDEISRSITEIVLPSAEYYEILQDWVNVISEERQRLLKNERIEDA